MGVYTRQRIWSKETLYSQDLNAEFDAVLASVNNVNAAQLSTGAVTTQKIATGAVESRHIGTGEVTTEKIAANAATASASDGEIIDIEKATDAITLAAVSGTQEIVITSIAIPYSGAPVLLIGHVVLQGNPDPSYHHIRLQADDNNDATFEREVAEIGNAEEGYWTGAGGDYYPDTGRWCRAPAAPASPADHPDTAQFSFALIDNPAVSPGQVVGYRIVIDTEDPSDSIVRTGLCYERSIVAIAIKR